MMVLMVAGWKSLSSIYKYRLHSDVDSISKGDRGTDTNPMLTDKGCDDYSAPAETILGMFWGIIYSHHNNNSWLWEGDDVSVFIFLLQAVSVEDFYFVL